jgi:HD-GYP domain-containing protein (c-di-GMP phosphodiesterase class II)
METTSATCQATSIRHFRMEAGHVEAGMFIAELDRPWLDTPFLMQGFVVDDDAQLETLRAHCAHVFVRLELSTHSGADAVRRLEAEGHASPVVFSEFGPGVDAAQLLADVFSQEARAGNRTDGVTSTQRAPTALFEARPDPARTAPTAPTAPIAPPERFAKRADVYISAETRERFRAFARESLAAPHAAASVEPGMLNRAAGWLQGLFAGGDRPDASGASRGAARRDASSRRAIRAELPRALMLTRYEDAHTVEAELPRARLALSLSEDVFGGVVTDIRAGRVPDLSLVAEAAEALVSSMIDNRDALLLVNRLRTEAIDTYNHSVNVSLYVIALGRQVGFPAKDLVHLGMIGMLADVGKLRLPRALLEKPGMLSPTEFAQVKQHVRLGLDTLSEAGRLPPEVAQGIGQHHERLDGSGYPDGLEGTQISIYGRMAAIADSFSALITPRVYAKTRSPQDALMNLYEWAGTSFHEPLVEQFVQAVGVFPVGSLVELSSGEVAIVVAHNRARRLEPRVLVLTGTDKARLPRPVERDLLNLARDGNARLRIARGLPAGAFGIEMRDYFAGRTLQGEHLAA